MKKYTRVITALALILLISTFFYADATKRYSITALFSAGFFQRKVEEAPEYPPGRYTTIVDDQENILSMMSRAVYVGDELYTAEGRFYRLEKVEGEQASARFLGIDPQIAAYNEFYLSQEVPVIKKKKGDKTAAANFAIYHTHSDESYIPSDGTASIIFNGGIYHVGRAMAERLRKAGMEVYHDQTRHDPHDNNAYVRSRRTAAKLLGSNPIAMFDVHRDGVPDPNFYRYKVSGKVVATVRLVVGRQNPRMSANLEFAKQMLSSANNVHPKVVKEIFVGKGNYNQDLLPTALLVEAGTYTNTREEAEQGVDLFAEALPTVLGLTPESPAPQGPAAPGKSPGAARGSWKALGWILGLTIMAGLAFMMINGIKLTEAKKRLLDFGREILPLKLTEAKERLLDFSREIMPLRPRRALRKPEVNNNKNYK